MYGIFSYIYHKDLPNVGNISDDGFAISDDDELLSKNRHHFVAGC